MRRNNECLTLNSVIPPLHPAHFDNQQTRARAMSRHAREISRVFWLLLPQVRIRAWAVICSALITF